MHHRYGRHGPHAWKHWRIQRAEQFQQLSRFIEPKSGNVLIHVHVIITDVERVIIISLGEISFPTHALKGVIVSALPAGLEPNLYANIRYLAAEDAEEKALSDLRQLDERLTSQELRDYAEALWGKYNYARDPDVRKEAIALRDKGIAPRDIYVQEFSTVYEQKLSEKGFTLLDNDTKAILKQARADKAYDEQQQVFLSDRERVAQAAIRVYQRLSLDPQQQREVLNQQIRLYESYYLKRHQEGGSGTLSSQNGFRSTQELDEESSEE